MPRQSRTPAIPFLICFAAVTLFANAGDAQGTIAGTYRVSSDRTSVEIPEWGSDCGPRPESHTGAAGRAATVAFDGSQATIQDGRHRYRTDGCWSDNPHVRRLTASRSGTRWTIVCQTPDSDYQHEQGTFTVTADGSQLRMNETTQYSWQLRESRCRATATRTLTYDRTGDVPQADAGAVVAQTARDSGPAQPPPRENRCANPGAPARLDVSPGRRSLAAGGRTCFRARVLDPNGCEVPGAGAGIAWALARNGGNAGGNDATLDGSCVRAPSGSPVAEYTISVTAGALSARALAAVVSVEELRSLVAQHIEDDPSESIAPTQTGVASGTGLGAVVVRAPPAPAGSNGSALLWLLLGTGVLLAVGGVALLTRKRSKVSGASQIRVSDPPPDAGPDPSSLSGRQRREAVAIPARELPIANGIVGPPSSLRTAEAPPSVAAAGPVERPLDKLCPKCGLRFTAENAFCPEDGVGLVASSTIPAAPASAPQPVLAPIAPVHAAVRLAPICPTCGKPVEGGVRFCPTDGTAVAEDALPLRCPKCNKQFAIGTAFCGEDGSTLVRA